MTSAANQGGGSGLDALARKSLETLLKRANRHAAGISGRAPALTSKDLSEYHALRVLKQMEDFDAAMLYCQAEGAIQIHRPRHNPHGQIERIDLVDGGRLASLLGLIPHAQRVEGARQILQGFLDDFPVLQDVISKWSLMKQVRGSSPEDASSWVAACQVIAHCRNQVALGVAEMPVRDVSARLFKDSKRVEALIPLLDALLCTSIEDQARPDTEVVQELGLYREEQPARLAGNVVIRRERGEFPLDRPYCALPPTTVLGVGGAAPSRVLSIENLTTFHVTARKLADTDTLVLYTAGMPSPAWRAMYVRLLASVQTGLPVCHWGDVDEGGFRIAAHLSRAAAEAGHVLQPWLMRPSKVPAAQQRPAPPAVVDRMIAYANAAGWSDLATEIADTQIVAEQEG